MFVSFGEHLCAILCFHIVNEVTLISTSNEYMHVLYHVQSLLVRVWDESNFIQVSKNTREYMAGWPLWWSAPSGLDCSWGGVGTLKCAWDEDCSLSRRGEKKMHFNKILLLSDYRHEMERNPMLTEPNWWSTFFRIICNGGLLSSLALFVGEVIC